MRVFIYTLSDPRDGQIRYVGKTTNLKGRLRQHIHEPKTTYKACWIESLKKAGVRPQIEELEHFDGDDVEQWKDAERFWISYLRSLGFRLVNLDAGGLGKTHTSLETRKKLSIANTGKKRSEAHCLKMSLLKKGVFTEAQRTACLRSAAKRVGYKHKPETLAKLKGRILGPSGRAKVSEARKGKPLSAEHRAKLSMARRGRSISKSHIEALLLGRRLARERNRATLVVSELPFQEAARKEASCLAI